MKLLHNHLKKHSDTLRLSADEKARLRGAIRQVMIETPGFVKPKPHGLVRSPYWWVSRHPKLVSALSGTAAALLLMSGTAYAAQGSLPGDVLYPIKVSVTEPLEGALAISAQAKAQWNASIAQERVDEAAELASNGELSTTTTQELESNFTQHADAATALNAEVAENDPAEGAQLTVQLRASLQGQAALLVGTSTQERVNSISRFNAHRFAALISSSTEIDASSTQISATSTASTTSSTSSPILLHPRLPHRHEATTTPTTTEETDAPLQRLPPVSVMPLHL
jgi:Domain of unknown function (DUF5667)